MVSHQTSTQMAFEIAEIPEVVERQLAGGLPLYRESGAYLRSLAPRLFIVCARGTSDHAATYFKYLMEIAAGIPVVSIGPSVASVFGAPLKVPDSICLTISQSGGSPDLVALQQCASQGGATTVALLNTTNSLVGAGADLVLPVLAGPEKAVAATKSYIANLVALAAIHAEFMEDDKLLGAMDMLPHMCAEAVAVDWSPALPTLAKASSIYVISRGPGFALAREAALKIKETCRLHAEAHSAAEVQHGPMAIADSKLAALAFVPEDKSRQSVIEAANAMARTGAAVIAVGGQIAGGRSLPGIRSPHPLLTPICQAVAFYSFVEKLAGYLGIDPDSPPYLKKATETV